VNWVTVVSAAIAAILGGGGSAALIAAVAKRRTTKVEAVDRLNEVTLEWAEALKTDAREARADAREARQEAAEARREAAEVRRQYAELVADVRRLHEAIFETGTTVERIRQAVTMNGRY
jgi:methyl-accepting chemotaxis protein